MHFSAAFLSPTILPTSRPSFGPEELAGIRAVLDSGWLGHGSVVLQFEQALRDHLGGPEVVAVGSGTAALHLALEAAGIGADDEVIVPSLTFCGSIQAITATGARPVFCEVSDSNLNLDPKDAAARITPRTKAIMPVHYAGNPCDMEALWSLGRHHGLRVIEDAAHAFGSALGDTPVGGRGDLTCFSFDPIKTITCGEGGAIVLRDAELAAVLRHKRLLGMDRESWRRHAHGQSWDYDVTTQGYRYHMGNLNAAIGLAQLAKLPGFRERRRHLAGHYNARLQGIPGLALLDWDLPRCCPFAYTLRIVDGRRDALAAHLRAHGIVCGLNYHPNHRHTHFRAYSSPLPRTEQLAREILTVPLFCDMADEDVERVSAMVAGFMRSGPSLLPLP